MGNSRKSKTVKIRNSSVAETRKFFAFNFALSFITAFALAILLVLSNLHQYGDMNAFFTWSSVIRILLITGIMMFALTTIILYTIFIRKDLLSNRKFFPIINISVLLTFVFCLLFSELINLYIVPLMLSALLVATLVDNRAGIITNVLISQAFFVTYVLMAKDDVTVASSAMLITAMVAGIIMIAYMGKANTRLKFVLLGFLVGIISSVIPILINLLVSGNSINEILLTGLWSFLATLISIALYQIVLPIFEYMFKINTNYRLSEICSFEFRLMKKLANEAPGTFNHSLTVGNMSELCASAIGENALMAKACAYYHDIGKTKNPEYFIENQKGYNPHDDLIPEVSIKIITGHTELGYDILKKERMPDIIADVAHEHHGTMPVNYFLYKAQNFTEEDLNKLEFSYQDPKPSSKIAAIVMIADTVEAATRAMAGKISTSAEFRAFIHKLIKEKSDMEQFSNCDITYKDLQTIENTLVDIVPNMYHTRIEYNKK